MTEIIAEQSNYGWTIFANDIPERLETHTRDSLRRPLASPVTFTIPARREWFGQHRRSDAVLGPFGSREEAQAAVDADYAAKSAEWTARLHVREFLGFVAGEIFASCVLGVICAFIPAMLLAGAVRGVWELVRRGLRRGKEKGGSAREGRGSWVEKGGLLCSRRVWLHGQADHGDQWNKEFGRCANIYREGEPETSGKDWYGQMGSGGSASSIVGRNSNGNPLWRRGCQPIPKSLD